MPSLIALLSSPLLTATLAWLAVACVDPPSPTGSPPARLVVAWDPLACGAPHRVAVELALADAAADALAVSAPCNLGALTIDVPALGSYRGRVYAWALAAPIRSVSSFEVVIDQPVVHRQVETPR